MPCTTRYSQRNSGGHWRVPASRKKCVTTDQCHCVDIIAGNQSLRIGHGTCDQRLAPAISGVAISAGSIQNVELTRLFTMEEIADIRQKARQLRGAYKPPGQQ